MNFIDSHSHIYCDAFDDDRDAAIARAQAAGVSHIVMPNESLESIDRLEDACRRYPGDVSMTIGLHPEEVKADYLDVLRAMEQRLTADGGAYKVVAIGEIGIDLYWDKTWREQQMEALDRQLHWCVERDLPFIIHCREAFDEIVSVMRNFGSPLPKGVFHSFTGTPGEVATLRQLGDFYFGVNGIVTFKKSEVKALLPVVGMERLLLETDSPYLAPVPHRGKRNESAYVVDVARFVASYLDLPLEAVADATSRNAATLFQGI